MTQSPENKAVKYYKYSHALLNSMAGQKSRLWNYSHQSNPYFISSFELGFLMWIFSQTSICYIANLFSKTLCW